jgi:uncharacterized protein (DUF302 family)
LAPIEGMKTMADGLVVVASALGFAETLERLLGALGESMVPVFAQIDHAAGAKAAGLALRPTTLVIFGAARAGTPLMAADQTMGLDLPLRALVYEDAAGEVHVAYNEPEWLAARHGLAPDGSPTLAAMTGLLEAVVGAAVGGGVGF